MITTSEPTEQVPIRTTVNGRAYEATVPADGLLVAFLRDQLGLTGTKEACSVGVCGVCSVLVNGEVLSACLVPAVRVDGSDVTTIEGIADSDGKLSGLQDAFIDHGGFQCGICTPGQVVSATALLAEHQSPDEAEVREWMTGNLCRCTGYYGILAAVLAASGAGPEVQIRPPISESVPTET